jgi:hypothetical protein
VRGASDHQVGRVASVTYSGCYGPGDENVENDVTWSRGLEETVSERTKRRDLPPERQRSRSFCRQAVPLPGRVSPGGSQRAIPGLRHADGTARPEPAVREVSRPGY